MRIKTLAVSITLLGLFAAPIFAQSEGKGEGAVWRASGQLKGMQVVNGTGDNSETLGHIEDVVVDLRRGEVVYYALGHGQTLGLGGKMFALAPGVLQMTSNGKYFILTGVSNKDLDAAQGFDANSWPSEPDKRWGKGQNAAGNPGKDGDGKPELARLTALTGSDVRNPQNKDLGSIYDLGVRFTKDKHYVVYAAVSHGGALGVGGKLFAVPLSKLQMSSPKLNPNHRAFILNINDDQFDQAGGFTSGQDWPLQANMGFWSKIQNPNDNKK
jgi:sporulation protein YlmC with PRC-barrel domain